jgi:hypothetical protein
MRGGATLVVLLVYVVILIGSIQLPVPFSFIAILLEMVVALMLLRWVTGRYHDEAEQ